jgi:hypothetical protein
VLQSLSCISSCTLADPDAGQPHTRRSPPANQDAVATRAYVGGWTDLSRHRVHNLLRALDRVVARCPLPLPPRPKLYRPVVGTSELIDIRCHMELYVLLTPSKLYVISKNWSQINLYLIKLTPSVKKE